MAWQWLSDRGPLPIILAGPILRRVEPGQVCVWVATQSAQSVLLTVRSGGAEVASNVSAANPVGQPTVQLGDKLFVALLTAVPAADLQANVLYTYDLQFTSPASGTVTTFAVALTGSASGTLQSIVYGGGATGSEATLPSFSLPPQTLSQVRIGHTSCRKAGGENPDAMPVFDSVISRARSGATDTEFVANRLHQLYLTGDQIYADDVTDSFLAMCIDAGGWLMGSRQEPAPKILGALYDDASGGHTFPVQADGWLPLFWRTLGPTTPWDASDWPGVGARGQLAFAAGYTVTSPKTTAMNPIKLQPPDLHYQLARNHLMALGEFYAAYLLAWSPVLWSPGTSSWPVPLPYDAENVGAVTGLPAIASYNDQDAGKVAYFGAGTQAVRRVLANVPTYMICDDHDVTDDWFMNRLWCERVLGIDDDTLGRRMVRNALIAYAVFQAWGNTPQQFDPAAPGPPPGAQLLTQLAAGQEMTDDLTTSSDTGISALLGMPGPLSPSSPALSRPTGSLTWSHRWSQAGWPFEVIMLDCRTLRRYGPGELEPPQLLDDGTSPSANADQFAAQLGMPAAAGTVTLVVAQTPVIGIRWIEENLQRGPGCEAIFGHDAEAWSLVGNGYQLMLAGLAAHNPMTILLSGDVHYSFVASADYWATTPWGAASLSAPRTARIIQLNSSAARNETALTRIFHTAGFSTLDALGMPAVETWAGFQTPSYHQITVLPNLPAIEKLNGSPAVLTAEEYKAVYASATPPPTPDWKYRIQFVSGIRDNAPPFNPPGTQDTMPADFLDPGAAGLADFVTYVRAAAGTEIIGQNNVCLVTFTGDDPASWHVQQAVMWRPDPGTGPQEIPADVTAPVDVTRFDVALQYGPEPSLG